MKTIRTFYVFLFGIICFSAISQSPVQQFFANYVSKTSAVSSYSAFPTNPGTFSGCSSNSYTHNWSVGSSNLLSLTSFNVNSKTMVVSSGDSADIKIRRVNNANVTGIRNILFCESTTAVSSCVNPRTLSFKVPYSDDMTQFLNNYVINQGTDNVFTNASNGDGNNNNIERVDVIFKGGLASAIPADAGFLFCERGVNNAHDGFRIAAILSLDVNNDPASFGAVATCVKGNGSNNGSWGHPSIANGNFSLAAYVLRKDPADTYLRVSAQVTQEIGGVFFSLADLGVAVNQVIYGYTLIGPDGTANPTSAQLLDLTNTSVFPTTTTEAQGGGLDLIAVNTFFGTNQALSSRIRTSFNGKLIKDAVLLEWELSNIGESTTITLQRSTNSVAFEDIHSYQAEQYDRKAFIDYPSPGIYFYRLRLKQKNGEISYSHIIRFQIQSFITWRVFPSVVRKDEKIMIEMPVDGLYEAYFTGIKSNLHWINLKIEGGKAIIENKPEQLRPGVYVLSLRKRGEWIGRGNKIVFLDN